MTTPPVLDARAAMVRQLGLMPPEQRAAAIVALAKRRAELEATDRPGARAQATRDPAQRRRYAGDPWAYFADILGWTLTKQQEEALELFERHTRVLMPSANNVGKSFTLGGYGVYLLDAVAALPNPDTGEAEQGARVLLPGPDHSTVFQTIYAEMLSHAHRAELRGHLMPGTRSEKSVLWQVRPKWHVEAFSPPDRVEQAVAHTASGRHHRNQHALIEEGQGVSEAVWRATEGMCSSAGNKILSSFNPTEPVGPAFERARAGSYRVIHLSAFQHPNVKTRSPVIPDAVDARVIDARVRADCRDRGPYPAVAPDPLHGDFLYALPHASPEDGSPALGAPRADGVLGAAGGAVHVYRPNPAFTAQVLGQWPKSSESGLFSTADLDRAMARWCAAHEPAETPTRIGLDAAREGRDDAVAAPAWGEAADALLRAFALAETQGAGAVQQLRAARRIRVGDFVVFAKAKGPEMAEQVTQRFPYGPITSDAGGVSSSPNDFLRRVHGRDLLEVSFAATPTEPVPGEPYSENTRTQLFVRLAMLVQRDLVDLPDDPLLRQELLALETVPTTRVVPVREPKTGRIDKKRMPAVRLIDKDEIKKKIGRSPDRADAAALAVHDAPRPKVDERLPAYSECYLTI